MTTYLTKCPPIRLFFAGPQNKWSLSRPYKANESEAARDGLQAYELVEDLRLAPGAFLSSIKQTTQFLTCLASCHSGQRIYDKCLTQLYVVLSPFGSLLKVFDENLTQLCAILAS